MNIDKLKHKIYWSLTFYRDKHSFMRPVIDWVRYWDMFDDERSML